MLAKTGRAGLALALAIGFGSSAVAQDQRSEALGLRLAHTLLTAANFEQAMLKGAVSSARDVTLVKSRPEWSALFIDSMQEEIAHDHDAFERMVGHALARDMTAEELDAGVRMLEDPGVMALLSAGSSNQTSTAQPGPEAQRIGATPAGRSFMTKLEHLDRTLAALTEDLMAEILPGTFRRFGEKAEAAEAKRQGR